MNLVPVGVDIAKLKFDVAVLLPNQKYKTKNSLIRLPDAVNS